MEDSVGDGGGDADLADLPHALGAERADQLVVHLDKSTVTSGASASTGTRYSAKFVAVHRPERGSMWLPSCGGPVVQHP